MLTKRNQVVFQWLVLALVVGFAGGCKPPGPKALLDGKRLLDKGRPDAAVTRLEVATQLMGTNANAWNYLGIAYHQTGRSSNAVLAYKRALTLNPDLVETRLNLGSLWLESGQAAEAKTEFTAYNLRRPNAPEGFSKIALAELHLRESAAAEQHIRKALQLDKDLPDAWNTLGLIQLQQGKPRDAAGSFGNALRLAPDFAPALINLAVVSHQQLGDRTGALQLYRRYLELKPRPSDADSVAAVARQLEQDLSPPPATPPPVAPKPASTVAVREETATPPATPPARSMVPVTPKPVSPAPVPPARKPAEETATTAQVPPARPAVTTAKATTPPGTKTPPAAGNPEPPVTVSPSPAPRVQAAPSAPVVAGGSTAKVSPAPATPAAASPSQPVTRKPGVTPLPPPRNTVFVESATVAEAAGSQTNGAGAPRSDSRITAERFAVKGNKAMLGKRYVEAADAYRAAAKADPGWFQAHFNHAAAAIEAGRTTEAIDACEKALALEPDSLEARYNFALALKQAGRYADAAGQLERVVAASPENARAHLTLGNLYADQLRHPDKARLHYLKVLEINPGHPQAGAIHFWLAGNPER